MNNIAVEYDAGAIALERTSLAAGRAAYEADDTTGFIEARTNVESARLRRHATIPWTPGRHRPIPGDSGHAARARCASRPSALVPQPDGALRYVIELVEKYVAPRPPSGRPRGSARSRATGPTWAERARHRSNHGARTSGAGWRRGAVGVGQRGRIGRVLKPRSSSVIVGRPSVLETPYRLQRISLQRLLGDCTPRRRPTDRTQSDGKLADYPVTWLARACRASRLRMVRLAAIRVCAATSMDAAGNLSGARAKTWRTSSWTWTRPRSLEAPTVGCRSQPEPKWGYLSRCPPPPAQMPSGWPLIAARARPSAASTRRPRNTATNDVVIPPAVAGGHHRSSAWRSNACSSPVAARSAGIRSGKNVDQFAAGRPPCAVLGAPCYAAAGFAPAATAPPPSAPPSSRRPGRGPPRTSRRRRPPRVLGGPLRDGCCALAHTSAAAGENATRSVLREERGVHAASAAPVRRRARGRRHAAVAPGTSGEDAIAAAKLRRRARRTARRGCGGRARRGPTALSPCERFRSRGAYGPGHATAALPEGNVAIAWTGVSTWCRRRRRRR